MAIGTFDNNLEIAVLSCPETMVNIFFNLNIFT